MKKVWHTPEFLFGIHWWTWKTTTKKLLKWANKNSKNFNIYNVVFFNISIFRMLCLFLKIKKKTWRYPNFAPAYQKSWWYDLHFLRYRVWQTEMKKNCWRYHHFTHVHQKPQSYAVQFLRYGVRHIFVILKNTWKFYPFTHVHHKSRSYDVWFMRYKVQRTKFIVILGNFLPSDPPNNPKNQNFEKILKNPGNIIILHLCTTNDDHMIRLRQMRHAVACTCLCTRLKH